MQRFVQYIAVFCGVLLLGLVSCNDDRNSLAPAGTLYLNVDQDESVLTKAQSAVTNERLRVDVISASGDTVKSYADYMQDVKGQKLALPVGMYTVAVASSQTEAAGWENPLYAGEETVEIKAGEITSTKVVCKIANTKVSVNYTDGVKEQFINYETTVSNSSGSLLYTRDEYRAGFFTPEKLTADLALTNKDGQKFTLRRVFTDIKPRYYYTITFKINDKPDNDDAGGNFELEVDPTSPDVINCIITITEDALEGKGAPVISLSDTFADNKVKLKEGNKIPKPLLLTILSKVGIERLLVKAESPLFKEKGLASFDLMNPKGSEAALAEMKFPIPDKKNSKDVKLDFNEFASYLLARVVENRKKEAHTFTVYALDSLHQEKEVTFTFDVQPDLKISTEDPMIWSKFVVLKGNAATKDNLAFMFKKSTDAEYKVYKVDPALFDEETGEFAILLSSGIESGTGYAYYATSGAEDRGEVVTFTTSGTPTIPNLGFEDWCDSDGITFPNKDLTDANYFWDSGNKGAKSANKKPTDSTKDAVKGMAVYMHSEMATILGIGAFAAGNIYTGRFNRTIMNPSNPGAELDFGQPYRGRPTRLTGYYKYQPVKVNKGSHAGMSGKMDKCAIYIALCKWNSRFCVNTQSSIFVDLDGDDIIALGELSDAEASRTGMAEYTKFDIDIKYRKGKVTTEPTYILIVASASKYGDYFTGGEGSKLYIDEFSLEFDYNPASFVGTELEKYQVK